MYYVNFSDGSPTHNIPVNLIVSLLRIPHEERSLKDHEIIYKFLNQNPILSQIQRRKSVNARLQCVAHLQINEYKPGQQTNFKIIAKVRVIDESAMQKARKQKIMKIRNQIDNVNIEQQIIYAKYYIVIEKDKYIDIMATNQKYLRQNIQLLKKYTILKDMNYQQLLHLSYYLQKQSFKYKQYVYKEREQSQYLYFVQQGQFHYLKYVLDDKVLSKHSKSLKQKPKRYAMMYDNPNKIKNSKSIQCQIGIIQGNCGQAFGQQQLLSDKLREYSVKCMSTQNSVLKVKKQYYLNVIKSTKTQMNWLKKQKQNKNRFKKQILDKIMLTKNNYSKYLQVISEKQKNQIQSQFEYQQQHKQQQNYNNNQALQNQHRSVSNFQQNPQETAYVDLYKSSSINQHLKSHPEQAYSTPQKFKHLKSQQSDQGNDTFALTKPIGSKQKNYHSNSGSYGNTAQLQIYTQTSKAQSILLPSISGKTSPPNLNKDTLQVHKVKSWSANKPSIDLKDIKSKFTKMIDSNALIREKQYILQRNLSKQTREDLFPMQMPKKKSKKLKQLQQNKGSKMKAQVRQLRSAAHSKDFMQNLLIQSLKKAGYNTNKNSKNYTSDNQNTIYDIKTNIRVPKKKQQQKKLHANSLLEDNPFDKYYFK